MWRFERYRLAGEVTRCPACASPALCHVHFVPTKRFIRQRQYLSFASGCRNCGLVFVNPPRTSAEMAEYYSEEGGWNERVTKPPRERDGREKDRRTHPSLTTSALVQVHERFGCIAGLKALDFGCGRGRVLDQLHKLGFDTYGIDPATHHLVTDHTMITAIPESPSFELIVAKHVLEHLTDPLDVLRRLGGALRPQGVLAVAVPDLAHAAQHGNLRYCINDAQHVSAFTRQSLSTLLAMAGLRVIQFSNSEDGRRLRCTASIDPHAPRPSRPLTLARRAIRTYRRTVGGESLLRLFLPVRLRAVRANQQEEARFETHVRQKKAEKKRQRAADKKKNKKTDSLSR